MLPDLCLLCVWRDFDVYLILLYSFYETNPFHMVRIHRSLRKKAQKIDASRVANDAEDYLDAFSVCKRYLDGVRGLASADRIKKAIKRIDSFEREILKNEDRIDRLMERRGVEAAKLDEELALNMEILEEYLSAEEIREFFG